MQICYQIDFARSTPEAAMAAYWAVHAVSPEVREFAEELVHGTQHELEHIDTLLEQYSANWRVARMAAVDRNILRVAVYELLHYPDIPIRVTLNEAIEIGKRFGTEESGAFVNGILDQIAKTLDKPME